VLQVLDAMVCMVLRHLGRRRDRQKRYRFTLPVSKRRMPVALSVDALCDFGAKNLDRCADFTQGRSPENLHTLLLISHFGVF
jgi:hypothetical protein